MSDLDPPDALKEALDEGASFGGAVRETARREPDPHIL